MHQRNLPLRFPEIVEIEALRLALFIAGVKPGAAFEGLVAAVSTWD
jgi:hypothetical protein